ncbi:CYTH and CHAD domain-containing protein [Actinacidiphila bryophytorum]|uniref:CYTH and CHAD domain-containing protein n=1 Tax=Actinacidiphila bryophytorum TaxID=1436133 RepID=UPI002176CF5C|nr:CYTH and CHAD domain-containing protein [Actinacidiphila bryophytorum]UWE08444.1 CYTH and CHAD domain-containing protein [Actinacidiphila bryophytorum]
MGGRVRETERKYEAGEEAGNVGTVRADLAGLTAGSRALDTVRLEAVYYDTAGLALAAHKVTLRRRTGGDDAGWHLKLPSATADTRTEVQADLTPAADGPPHELRQEIAALARGQELRPVARLRTARRRVLLLDEQGGTLAEVAYDRVEAQALPDGRQSSWSEVEVELGEAAGGDPALLDAVEERFAASGLHRSASASKLARALGGLLVAPPAGPPAVPGSAGQTAVGYLHAQLTAILALDPAVRRDEEDAVHQMRVATRRARSALKSFRKELDRAVTDPLGAELKWLAAVLGTERDREVLAERLSARLAELDPGLATDAVKDRLHALAAGTSTASHSAVLHTLDGARYFALLDALEALTAAPPYRKAARKPAAEAAAATVERDLARLRRGTEAALALEPGPDKDVALHEARKAAKRARYSGEAVQPVLGARAKAHTGRMKSLQQLLGEHQDSVLCRTALAGAAREAAAAGEDPAPYDALLAAEGARAAQVEAELPEAWARADLEV